LTGCGSPTATVKAVSEKNLVEVPAVIGALKCAFAVALDKEIRKKKRRRLSGKVADVTLSLQIVDTSELKGEAKVPVILALGAGSSVTPYLNGSYARTNTVETIVKFRLRLVHESKYESACKITPQNVRDQFGFENWLGSVIEGLEPNAIYAPAGELDSIEFKGSFGVQKKVGTGAEFKVVFVSGKADYQAGRNDIQAINFKIAPPSKTVKLPDPGVQGPDVLVAPNAVF